MLHEKLRFFVLRLGERLWVRPLLACVLSLAAVLVAAAADQLELSQSFPRITLDSVEALLSVMAASMLVIATFAVASMVSAYASASNTATPRSFSLIVADDLSQNALSVFIAAFIFSIVGLTATKNEIFQPTGLTALFVLTVLVFALVILTFVRWVDRIARLGRLDNTVEKVETATRAALLRRRQYPSLGGVPVSGPVGDGIAVTTKHIGYVQHIAIDALQAWATRTKARVQVAALPGTFIAPGRPLAYVRFDEDTQPCDALDAVVSAFETGRERLFSDDPRFGLVVLSEIAGRALSPGINDPGSAITVIGVVVRLLSLLAEPAEKAAEPACTRVEVPELDMQDMFDDAFTAIARDGASSIEVMVRLQKAFQALSLAENQDMAAAARGFARTALIRAENALQLPAERALIRQLASLVEGNG